MASLVRPVATRDLDGWPTKRLLALRTRLLRCEASLEESDVQDASELDPALIRFKDDPRWRPLYDAVIARLDEREHVPSGAERAEQRRRRGSPTRGRGGERPAKRRRS
ncbi:MAG: hypothetical protein AAGH15_08885 [Myxococcota bacterium]